MQNSTPIDIPAEEMEKSSLFSLIHSNSRKAFREAWNTISQMSDAAIKQRSAEGNTYLHLVVSQASDVYNKHGSAVPLVSLIYRLALRGVYVNAQNEHGNTALHLACIKPHAEALCQHLIRVGADPRIQNRKGMLVVHTYHNHRCALVKGQTNVGSGIWHAVEREDLELTEKLLKSWCRVKIRKKKSLLTVADETGNVRLQNLLRSYEVTNELACYAFACDTTKVKEILKSGNVNIYQQDEAYDIPKPLIISLQELGDITKDVIGYLRHASTSGQSVISAYEQRAKEIENAFESSELYSCLDIGSEASLLRAVDLVRNKKIDFQLTSKQESSKGWTYFHLAVDRYLKIKVQNEERARLIIRLLYTMALAGGDVNARDSCGNTPFILAGASGDQILLAHLIRLGADSTICDKQGRAVFEEVYEDRGKLVFRRKYRLADLPGLWAAIEIDDVVKAEKWLKSWTRVNVKRGDRRLIDIARSLNRAAIVNLLESYERLNEFVCASFACDLDAMKYIIAQGKGDQKTNITDEFFHVGFTWDRHAEFMSRPIIITALEICTPEVIEFLIRFGANLSREYEESFPCGPAAFWAFRDHVNDENALVVARYADVNLKDELGATLLHKAVGKKRFGPGKQLLVHTLLERGANVAARDSDGSTPRDYTYIYSGENSDDVRQIIDNHVLDLVETNRCYEVETLILEAYDHVTDVKGSKRNKTAIEVAILKEFKELVQLFHETPSYRAVCDTLHEAAKSGDIVTISKMSGEKRCAWSRDKGGRSLLHNAVLYEHTNIVKFLLEQYPNLINTKDNSNRTPLHLCVCLKERHLIWPILQDAGADPNIVDVNNMSVYEYVRQLETPTKCQLKPRGRRILDYKPSEIIDNERCMKYGAKAECYVTFHNMMKNLKSVSLADIRKQTSNFQGSFAEDNLDAILIKECIDHRRQEIAKHLIEHCGCRPKVLLTVYDKDSDSSENVLPEEYANKQGMKELAEYLRKIGENAVTES